MLTEPNIEKDLILKELEKNFDLKEVNLTYIPAGEASWCYKVETEKEIYFLKIYINLENHKTRFNLTYNLFSKTGIKNITHPLKNKEGNLVFPISNNYAALFNFIDGFNASEKPLTDKEKFALGVLLGKIHKSTSIIKDFDLKEDFEYKNINRLLANIKSSTALSKTETGFKKQTAELLLKYQDKIFDRIKKLTNLGEELRNKNLDFVICHGEPHIWNTMVDKNGQVFLIDWDDSLLAPKEKDLNMIKDDPKKLEGYKSVTGNMEINQEVVRYYNWEWNISEIDAWSNQILNSNFNEKQNQHDLELLIEVLRELDENSDKK